MPFKTPVKILGKPPQLKHVMGKVMGECPQLRSDPGAVSEALESIVFRKLLKETLKSGKPGLSEIAPELIEALSVKNRARYKGLKPPRRSGTRHRLYMRFAPNPNGPGTLGSARGMVVNPNM